MPKPKEIILKNNPPKKIFMLKIMIEKQQTPKYGNPYNVIQILFIEYYLLKKDANKRSKNIKKIIPRIITEIGELTNKTYMWFERSYKKINKEIPIAVITKKILTEWTLMETFRLSIMLKYTLYFEYYEKENDAITRKQELEKIMPNAIYDIIRTYLFINHENKKLINQKHSTAEIIKTAISD